MSNVVFIRDKKCKGCNQTVPPFSGRVFCTNECRNQWYAARKVHDPSAPQTCEECGCTFNGRKRRFCCAQCRDRMQERKDRRQCDRCGEWFSAKRATKCRACRQYIDRQRSHRAAALRYKSQEAGGLNLCPTAVVGALAEKMFEIMCIRKAWLVCKPDADCNPGFDRIIVRDGQYERVQVKGVSGSRFEDGQDWQFGGGIARLNMNAIDTVAIVDVDSGFMWLVPKAEIARNFYPTNYQVYEHHCLGDVQ